MFHILSLLSTGFESPFGKIDIRSMIEGYFQENKVVTIEDHNYLSFIYAADLAEC